MKLSDKNFAKIIAKVATKNSDNQAIAQALWTELNQSKKLKDLDHICELAEDIIASSQGSLIATVSSATTLAPDQLVEITRNLSSKFNKKIILKHKIDSSLGAGITVETNGNIYDISLKNKIQRLKQVINS